MNNIMDEIITFDTEKDKDLIEYFNEDSISVWDLINEFRSVLAEKEQLKNNLEENYVQKEIDPYAEFGISERDF